MRTRRNNAYLASAAIALLTLASGSVRQVQAQAAPPALPGVVSTPAAADDGHTISIDVEVSDKLGHHLTGLTQGEFTLLDNKQPAKILAVHEVDTRNPASDPVHVVIVIDTINTDFDVIAREREQLQEFLKQDSGKLAHPTSMVMLTDKGISIEKASLRDGNALVASLDGTNSPLRMVGRS
jgi:hypothetical protein